MRPRPAGLAFSERGAPPEPQRTTLRVGVSDRVHAIPLLVAIGEGLAAQEAVEPTLVDLPARLVVPNLVAQTLDVAILDVAAFVGEVALGWEGTAVGAFGPVRDDRSVGLLVTNAELWRNRRDTGERILRACVRGLARARESRTEEIAAMTRLPVDVVVAAGLDDWWPDCTPDLADLERTVAWAEGRRIAELRGAIGWSVQK